MAKQPINIVNLLTNEGDRRTVFSPLVVFVVPVLPSRLPSKPLILSGMSFLYLLANWLILYLAAMAPKVDDRVRIKDILPY